MRVPPLSLLGCVGLLLASACGGRIEATPQDSGNLPDSANNQGWAATPGAAPATGDASAHDLQLETAVAAIALDEASIYVADVMGGIKKFAKSDGAIDVILPPGPAYVYPEGLAVDDGFIYWTELGGRIMRVAKHGGSAEPLATGRKRPWSLVSSGTTLFWTEQGSDAPEADDGAVVALELGGSKPVTLADGQPLATALAVSGDDVFFSTVHVGGGEVRRVSTSGGAVTTLSAGRGVVTYMAVRDDLLAWSEDYVGYSLPKAGGTATLLAGSQGIGSALAFAGADVVFAARTTADVHLLAEHANDPAPTELGLLSYPGAISILQGVAAASDPSGAYVVDTWYGHTDAKPHSVIHHVLPR